MRLTRPRLPTGLRWRLTAWVAGVMLVAAAIVFVAVYINTGNELRSQIDRDLAGDTAQLKQVVQHLGRGTPQPITAAAKDYLKANPFTASSTLLYVIIPGDATVSNHPEVFAATGPEAGESASEQAAENAAGQRLRVPRIGYSIAHVPDVGRVRLMERVSRAGDVAVVVGAGEPLALVEQAQHGVAKTFALASLLTVALALVASYLAGARVTAPLRRMARVAARVDAGDLEPRMDPSARSGREVQVLAEAFNHMLDRLSEAFASQREFVADASHELRTPLTVIRGQLEVLAAQHNPDQAEVRHVERQVQAEITRISRLVDDLLLLAQVERVDFLRPEAVDLAAFVTDLWDGISLTADREFELGAIPEGTLRADPDRLAQAVRNLARNAIEHTRDGSGKVRLEVHRVGSERICFAVIDDGPGIAAGERERIFERFHRTDSGRARSAGGAGLGLAIVRAIAEAHGGEVRAADPQDGSGAMVELILPGFRAEELSADRR